MTATDLGRLADYYRPDAEALLSLFGKTFLDDAARIDAIARLVAWHVRDHRERRGDGLTFNTLRRANRKRLPLFKDAKGRRCHAQDDGSDWSPAQWLQAVTGELGEYANLRKKVERGDLTIDEAAPALADELADVVIYLDILASQLGIELGEAVMSKWNRTSERVGAPLYIDSEGCWNYDAPEPEVMSIDELTLTERP